MAYQQKIKDSMKPNHISAFARSFGSEAQLEKLRNTFVIGDYMAEQEEKEKAERLQKLEGLRDEVKRRRQDMQRILNKASGNQRSDIVRDQLQERFIILRHKLQTISEAAQPLGELAESPADERMMVLSQLRDELHSMVQSAFEGSYEIARSEQTNYYKEHALRVKLSRTVADQETKINKLEQQRDKAIALLEAERKKLESSQSTTACHQALLDKLDVERTALETRFTALEARNGTLEARNAALEGEEVALGSENSKLVAQNEANMSEITTLRSHIAMVITEQETFQREKSSLQSEVAALRTEKNAFKAETVALQTEKNSFMENNASLETHKASLEAHKASLEKQKAALEKQKAALENDNASLKAHKTSLAIDKTALEAQKAALEKQRAALEKHKASLENDNASLKTHKASLEHDKAALEKQKSALVKDNASLWAHKASLTTDKAVLQKDRDALEKDKASLVKHRASLENDRTALEKVLAQYTEAMKLVGADLSLQDKQVAFDDVHEYRTKLQNLVTCMMETGTSQDCAALNAAFTESQSVHSARQSKRSAFRALAEGMRHLEKGGEHE